jgi:hypothetical protein
MYEINGPPELKCEIATDIESHKHAMSLIWLVEHVSSRIRAGRRNGAGRHYTCMLEAIAEQQEQVSPYEGGHLYACCFSSKRVTLTLASSAQEGVNVTSFLSSKNMSIRPED